MASDRAARRARPGQPPPRTASTSVSLSALLPVSAAATGAAANTRPEVPPKVRSVSLVEEVSVGHRLGAMAVGEQVYWLLHADDGCPRVGPALIGPVLAGALLGELVLGGKAHLWGPEGQGKDWLALNDPNAPTDELAAWLYLQIARDPHQTLATWISVLTPVAAGEVVTRMQHQNLLVPGGRHRFVRLGRWSGPAPTPAGLRVAPLPCALLSNCLRRRTPLPVAAVFVVALAVIGVRRHLLEQASEDVHRHVRALIEALPRDLLLIVAQVEAAVGSAVLAPPR